MKQYNFREKILHYLLSENVETASVLSVPQFSIFFNGRDECLIPPFWREGGITTPRWAQFQPAFRRGPCECVCVLGDGGFGQGWKMESGYEEDRVTKQWKHGGKSSPTPDGSTFSAHLSKHKAPDPISAPVLCCRGTTSSGIDFRRAIIREFHKSFLRSKYELKVFFPECYNFYKSVARKRHSQLNTLS